MPGKFSITGKDLVVNNYFKYREKFQSKKKCLDTINFFTETFRLYHKEECLSFFKFIRSAEYKSFTKNVAPYFITKYGRDVHKGKGVTVIFEEEEN